MNIEKTLARFRVERGKGFRLDKHDPADVGGTGLDKATAPEFLARGVARLAELQTLLYAQDRWSVLCIFQAMDAAGKDGAIKHVFSGVNPQGCHVTSFKHPGPVELDHDFLWRHVQAMPQRGQIGIHNRSWYEEVLVVRVHPELLEAQKLPTAVTGKDIWTGRLTDIASHEAYLARQGVVVLKFFLNISQEEQKRRLLSRMDDPAKHWKFNHGDLAERQLWPDYMAAYEAAIAATATPQAPWYVVPADRKWLTRLIVVAALVRALEALDLHYPAMTAEDLAQLAKARADLV